MIYGAIAAGLVAIVVILALVLKEAPISTPPKGPPVATMQPSHVESQEKARSGETGPASGTAPVAQTTQERSNSGTSSSAQQTPSPPAGAQPPKLKEAMEALEAKRYEEAVKLYEEISAEEPSLKAEIVGPYARALQGEAGAFTDQDPEKAKSLLLKSIHLDPGSVQGNFQLGLLYVKMKDYPKAIETYQRVAELDPQFPDTFFNLGYVYAVAKDYPKAEAMYERVVELAPSYLDEALFNLAIVQEKQGKREPCIKNLERALDVNPKNQLAKQYLQKLKEKSGGGK